VKIKNINIYSLYENGYSQARRDFVFYRDLIVKYVDKRLKHIAFMETVLLLMIILDAQFYLGFVRILLLGYIISKLSSLWLY